MIYKFKRFLKRERYFAAVTHLMEKGNTTLNSLLRHEYPENYVVALMTLEMYILPSSEQLSLTQWYALRTLWHDELNGMKVDPPNGWYDTTLK